MSQAHGESFAATILLALALLFLIGCALAAGAQPSTPTSAPLPAPTPKWTVMNRLEGRYRISYDLRIIGPDGKTLEDGRLTIDTKPLQGGGYKVYVLYRIGDITGGLTLNDAEKVGFDSILIPALVREPGLDIRGVRLLAAPFYFLAWQNQFYKVEWADGAGWLIRDANPEVEFSARSSRPSFGRATYQGVLRLGGRDVLDIRVAPEIPLPVESAFRDRDGLGFQCEMVEYKEGSEK